MMTRFSPVFALCAALALPESAWADSMRCGTQLVSNGDSQHEVRARCGEPAATQQRVELRTTRQWVNGPCVAGQKPPCGQFVEQTVEVKIDEWTYDFGPRQFVHHLTFEQGVLRTVTTGSYGNR